MIVLHMVDNDCEILGVKIITVLNVLLCFIGPGKVPKCYDSCCWVVVALFEKCVRVC